ncbi:DNA polymerase III subunit beta [Infirmifilum uzonense]|uniref:DNA polymerase III subunit beta n=1 Tax=Infirmifilum uzonense TaxID=1550241 RepID=A0A0F7FID7_9CREN|nr:nucleotidyltransferase domain-containing protein [Infirmifilum uzonense]AKG39118.1 DNA polymerase III subunit beta [Infirmifilum uzonense]
MKSRNNPLEVAVKVKRIVQSIDPEARFFLFGSAVCGPRTAAGDIDVLVVSEFVDRKYDVMVSVYEEVLEPVEGHVTTRVKFETWYKRFIPSGELVEV